MQVIGLHIGSSFAEVSVWKANGTKASPSRTASAVFYLPRQNLKSALPKFFAGFLKPAEDRIDAAFITTRFLERLCDYRLGGSTAQLMTAGLESWPFLNGAPSRAGWMQPQKSLPIASQELSFAINERLSAEGEVLKPLDPRELAAVAEKLRPMNIRRVCVHFLHARRNAVHQDMAAAWLREQGFDVFLPPADAPNESAAWRASTLEASFAGTFDELFQDIEKGFAEVVPAERLFFHDGRDFVNAPKCSRVASLFGEDRLLGERTPGEGWILDLGLESWRLLDPSRDEDWRSPWGQVAARRPRRFELRWQPTLAIGQTEDHDIGPGRRPEGYEPGPISFGRGQKLLVFDLFADDIPEESGLREQISETARSRREGVLNALGRQTVKKDAAGLVRLLREKILESLVLDVNLKYPRGPLRLTGFFAPILEKELSARLKGRVVPTPRESSADRAAKAGWSKESP
ncbi:MAG: hypothetical protein KF865_04170 [Bdellovibrionaceae bacterium]|nr:hypothetical protein [Pseudobdellovibrionaceae bacterium]